MNLNISLNSLWKSKKHLFGQGIQTGSVQGSYIFLNPGLIMGECKMLTCQPQENIFACIWWMQWVHKSKISSYFVFKTSLLCSKSNYTNLCVFSQLYATPNTSRQLCCQWQNTKAFILKVGVNHHRKYFGVTLRLTLPLQPTEMAVTARRAAWSADAFTWIEKPRPPVYCWTTDNDVEVEHRL